MTDIDQTQTVFTPTMIGEVVRVAAAGAWPYEAVGILDYYGVDSKGISFYRFTNEPEERELPKEFTVTRVKEGPLMAAVNELGYMLANLTTNLERILPL